MPSESRIHAGLENEFGDVNWLESIHFFAEDFVHNQELAASIKDRLTPENFLGEGGAGKVFDLGNGVCIKLMVNRENSPNRDLYDLGNSPAAEAEFLHQLGRFKSEEVYSPRVYGYYVGKRGAAIIMETLDAVNLQRALLGKENLPENFDFDDFFDRLEAYTQSLHAKMKIAHCDLDAKNMMVDRKTGRPIVIDFGRAAHLDKERPAHDPRANKDMETLAEAYSKAEKILAPLTK